MPFPCSRLDRFDTHGYVVVRQPVNDVIEALGLVLYAGTLQKPQVERLYGYGPVVTQVAQLDPSGRLFILLDAIDPRLVQLHYVWEIRGPALRGEVFERGRAVEPPVNLPDNLDLR